MGSVGDMSATARHAAMQSDATAQPDEPASEVTVTVLLAGTPTPTPGKWGTAILVRSATTTVLVDVGPGATRSLVRAGVGPTEVDGVVFSHHHFDHNAGFPAFFLSRWDQGAGLIDDLLVYGPPPTVGFVDKLFAAESGAFWPDLHARMRAPVSQAVYLNRGGDLPRLPPDPQVRNIHPGDGFMIGDVRFIPGLARHVQPFLDSNAYRIEVGSSSAVYTGDTEPCDEVIELARGDRHADLDVLGRGAFNGGKRRVARTDRHPGRGESGRASRSRIPCTHPQGSEHRRWDRRA